MGTRKRKIRKLPKSAQRIFFRFAGLSGRETPAGISEALRRLLPVMAKEVPSGRATVIYIFLSITARGLWFESDKNS
jgi:hypothetical protein